MAWLQRSRSHPQSGRPSGYRPKFPAPRNTWGIRMSGLPRSYSLNPWWMSSDQVYAFAKIETFPRVPRTVCDAKNCTWDVCLDHKGIVWPNIRMRQTNSGLFIRNKSSEETHLDSRLRMKTNRRYLLKISRGTFWKNWPFKRLKYLHSLVDVIQSMY
jgi:hypothetical protein